MINAIEIKTMLNDSFPPHSCFSNCIRIHVATPNPQSLQVWILKTKVFKPGIDIVLMNMVNQSERFHAVGWENAVCVFNTMAARSATTKYT